MRNTYLRVGQHLLARIIIQNPSDNFIRAYNNYYNWIKKNTRETENDFTCLIHDEMCEKTVDCHLISKKANLSPIADEKKMVRTLGVNHTCPANEELKPTAIKAATTFRGFCGYHDSTIFKPLESGQIDQYNQEQIFLLCLRAAASQRCKTRKNVREGRFLQHSFHAKEVKELLCELLSRDRLIDQVYNRKNFGKLGLFFQVVKCVIGYRHKVRDFVAIAEAEYAAFDQLICTFINQWKRKDLPRMRFCQFKVETQKIAFSTAIRFRCGAKDRFFFLFVLPNKEHSDILVACLESDYKQLIKHNQPLLSCFEGDIKTIEKIISIHNDSIVFSGKDFDGYEYMKYVYESNDPIADLFIPNLLH